MDKITHIIIKKEDVETYLTKEEQETFMNLQNKIANGRMNAGKPATNECYMCIKMSSMQSL